MLLLFLHPYELWQLSPLSRSLSHFLKSAFQQSEFQRRHRRYVSCHSSLCSHYTLVVNQ